MPAGNIGLAKAGLTEVIEHLYFYQHLCLTSADDFQIPCLRQALSRYLQFYKKYHHMEEKSTFEEFEKSQKQVKRRRDLLPLWIKIFTWIFLIFGVFGIAIPILGLFFEKLDLSLYGLATTQVFSPIGIIIVTLFIFKGIVAFGLWFEKDWAPKLAIIDAVIGIAICGYMMLVNPFISGNRNFTIRLELLPLIPYLLKMQKINKLWMAIK